MDIIKAELFEQFVRIIIKEKQRGPVVTEVDIREAADEARIFRKVDDETFQHVIRVLHTRLQISMDTGIAVVGNEPHKPWLHARRADIDSYYWNRYKQQLEFNKGWNERVVNSLGNVTDEILDLLGDPEDRTPWQRRGLVLGDVQSGKTATYTALINKAVDAGYRVVILLAGIQENLRRQTQERLDADFVGQDSKQSIGKTSSARLIGVGTIDGQRKAATFTSNQMDFNSIFLNNNNMRIKDYNEPVLFVVKKNKKILQNLETWLRIQNADSNGTGKIHLPLLLIDDEADNASINTRDQEDPTAINEAIRKLLVLFNQASYVGVTATPFANIFIHPDTNDEMIGDDLFPRDFIYALSPPTNYIGNHAIFGEDAAYRNSLIEINDAEDLIPIKHKSNQIIEELPESLWEALRYFLLVNTVRDLRKQLNTHRTMMVNVSRFTVVQDQVASIIQDWLSRVQSDIKMYSSLPSKEACQYKSFSDLEQTWNNHKLSEVSELSWEEVLPALRTSTLPIMVKTVNQRTGAASLDYRAYEDTGLRVIAVGGNSLSRGLTLEGLTVSYFYRNSQMYDTLLQMGRWFGYRGGYEDICRIWMSPNAMSWFSYITMATHELRDEIKRMNRNNQTPAEFGLKVREHPDSLIVTARNKMRYSQFIYRTISVSGKLLETPRVHRSSNILHENRHHTEQFISELDNIGRRVPSKRNEILWTGIPKDIISSFIRGYKTHPLHLQFQSADISNYIESAQHLPVWDVVLPGGEGNLFEMNSGKISLHLQKRTMSIDSGSIQVNGKSSRVGSRGMTRAGLNEEQVLEIEKHFKDENPDKKNIPDNAYLIKDRRPLLMIHLLEPVESPPKSDFRPKEIPIIALGVAFPRFKDDSEDGNAKVSYRVNLIEARSMFASETLEDDDHADD